MLKKREKKVKIFILSSIFRMDWDRKAWFSPLFTYGLSRYFIMIVALFIITNLFNQVKPKVSEFLSVFWIRWIFLFLAVLVLISDMNQGVTYRKCAIAFVSSLLFTIFAYFFLYDSYKMVFTQAQIDDIKLYLQHPEIQELIKNIKKYPDSKEQKDVHQEIEPTFLKVGEKKH